MKVRHRTHFLEFLSDNRNHCWQSKIENGLGLFAFVVAFTVCGARAEAQQAKKIPGSDFLCTNNPAAMWTSHRGISGRGYGSMDTRGEKHCHRVSICRGKTRSTPLARSRIGAPQGRHHLDGRSGSYSALPNKRLNTIPIVMTNMHRSCRDWICREPRARPAATSPGSAPYPGAQRETVGAA